MDAAGVRLQADSRYTKESAGDHRPAVALKGPLEKKERKNNFISRGRSLNEL